MISVFGDDSSDRNHQEVLSVGAFWGWSADFSSVEAAWQDRLQRDGVAYFHATECESLSGQFDPVPRGLSLNSARAFAESVRYDLIQILDKSKLDGAAVSLSRRDFSEVMLSNPIAQREYPADPTVLTYRSLIKLAIDELLRLHPHFEGEARVDFVFDDHSNWEKAEIAYEVLRQNDPLCRQMVGSVKHSDDKNLPALQMADLMAHEARYHALSYWGKADVNRHSLKNLVNSLYIHATIGKKELLAGLPTR